MAGQNRRPGRDSVTPPQVALLQLDRRSAGPARLAPGRTATILVVDDEEGNRVMLGRILEHRGYAVETAGDGPAALAILAATPVDLVLLDVQMPGMNGIEICRTIKETPASRLTPVVLVTGLTDREHRIAGIEAGADDFVSKPFDHEELAARVASLVRLKRYTDELESAESVILSLALTVEARDPYTDGHCQRLAVYARALGARLGLPDDALVSLERGGYLHDVGKIGIPDAVLQKPGPLTAAEFETMKQHTVIGEGLCGTLNSLEGIRPIVRSHHERRDGSGYPDGLRGDDIPLAAQIIAIVDSYDAMTTTRPYRPALSAEHAFGELARETERGLHREDLMHEFIALGRAGALRALADAANARHGPPGCRHADG